MDELYPVGTASVKTCNCLIRDFPVFVGMERSSGSAGFSGHQKRECLGYYPPGRDGRLAWPGLARAHIRSLLNHDYAVDHFLLAAEILCTRYDGRICKGLIKRDNQKDNSAKRYLNKV